MSAVGLPEPIGVCKNPTCGTVIDASSPERCAWCGWPADKVPTNKEWAKLLRDGGTELQVRRKREGYAVKP